MSPRAGRVMPVVRAAAGVLAVAALAFVATQKTPARTSVPNAASSASTASAVAPVEGDGRYGHLFTSLPAPGSSFVYRFTWSQKAEGMFPGRTSTGANVDRPTVGMHGTLRLTSLVPRESHTVMALEVTEVAALSEDPRSQEIAQVLAKDIAGSTAFLVFHEDGALQSIRYADGTTAAFSNFVQRAIGATLHAVPENKGDREMTRSEATPFGVATTKYEQKGDRLILRSRVAYERIAALPGKANLDDYTQELESGARFAFREDGALASLVDTETLKVTRADDGETMVDSAHGFSLTLTDAPRAEGEKAPVALGAMAAHVPWESTIDPASERKAVEARLDGLTGATMLAHVRAVAALGDAAPDQTAFFNRATGYLKLHPEESAAFVDLIHEKHMTYEGRAFAVDLLTGAGNDVVQATLVRVLDDPRTRALPEYFALYQRLNLLQAPSGATVAFAQKTFDKLHGHPAANEKEEDLRTASVYALGSIAGHMKTTKRLEAAEAIGRLLVAKMGDEEANRAHENAYLAALGNAGLPSQEPLLLGLTDDGDQARRVAAINALRKYDTPQSRARVMGILTAKVGSPKVDFPTQAEALRAGSLMTLARGDVKAIADAIVKDTLHRDLYGDVLPIFRKGKATYAELQPALDAMFERASQRDDDLQTRIDTLRAELSAGT